MAEKRITELDAQADGTLDVADLIENVDVSDTSMAGTGTNKKLSWQFIQNWILSFITQGHVIQDGGLPVPTEPALNFVGNAVAVSDETGVRTTVSITNANVVNLGGGAGIYKQSTGQDPITAELLTLESTDLSVDFTVTASTIDLSATGAGGGQSNTASNAGVGGIGVTLPKNGVDLPFKSLDSANALLSVADAATNRVLLTINEASIDHDNILNGGGSNSHIDIDQHIADNSVHFALSTIPGAGLVQNVSVIDVGEGAGITVSAAAVAVTNPPAAQGDMWSHDGATQSVIAAGVVGTPLLSGGGGADNAFGQVTSLGIANSAVTREKEGNMLANTVRMRPTAAGVPADIEPEALLDGGTPAPGDSILGQKAGGDLVSFDGSVMGLVTNPPSADGELWSYLTGTTQRVPAGTAEYPLVSAGGLALPAFAQLATTGLEDAAVSNVKLADMLADRIKLRGAGTGAPGDTKISALPVDATPGAGHLLLAEAPAGALVHVDVDTLPGVVNGPSAAGEMWSHDGATTATVAAGAAGLPIVSQGAAVPTFAALTSTGVGNNAITNAKLADMASGRLKVRYSPGTADPEDAGIGDLVDLVSPAPGDKLIGWDSAGGLRQMDVSALPGAGDVTGPTGAIAGNIAVYADTSGKLLADGEGDIKVVGDPSRLTINNSAGGTAQVKIINDGNTSGVKGSSLFQGTGGFTVTALADDGSTATAGILSASNATGVVDLTSGPPTHTGGSRVMTSAAANIPSGVLAQGSADTWEVESASVPTASVVRSDTSTTIEEIGYLDTPTVHDLNIDGSTFAPQFADNNSYRLINTSGGSLPVTIDIPGVGEGDLTITIESTVGAVSFSAAPDIKSGADDPDAARVLTIIRYGTLHTAIWNVNT